MLHAVVFALLASISSAFLFPSMGGGGGCCCQPPAPPPTCCAPPAPPPQPCCPPPPPPPPPPAPCCAPPPAPAPSCGCGCGRKKREAAVLASEDMKCNSEELRELILKNIKDDVSESIASLKKALAHEQDYVLSCNSEPISFVADVDDFCQVEAKKIHCAIMRLHKAELKEDEKEKKSEEKSAEPESKEKKKAEENQSKEKSD